MPPGRVARRDTGQVTTPPILPGSSPGLPVDPSVSSVQVLPATSPTPVIPLTFDVQDLYTDLYADLYGVPVLLTTVPVLPPSSP